MTVNPCSLCVRLVFPVHHVFLGELVGFIHFVDGLIEFLRLGSFDVELVQEFFIEFLQLDEVCGDIVVMTPKDESVTKFDGLFAARKGEALLFEIFDHVLGGDVAETKDVVAERCEVGRIIRLFDHALEH